LKKEKNMRKAERIYKKFMVIVGSYTFKGRDLSENGFSFIVNYSQNVSFLNQQKISVVIAYSLEGVNYNYELIAKVTNHRRLSPEEGIYGCQIVSVKLMDMHTNLISSIPEAYPMLRRASDRALTDVKVVKPSGIPDSLLCEKIKNSFVSIRNYSVDENISDELFREMVFKITNECIEE
jgi:hypothetical protein